MASNTRVSSSGAGIGGATNEHGTPTGRENPIRGSPSAMISTGNERFDSASASARRCTTPPRGFVE